MAPTADRLPAAVNLALTPGARGGVYIGDGIVPRRGRGFAG